MRCALLASIAGLVCTSGIASAVWDPSTGQWGKTDPNDIRIMYYNVRDTLCSTNVKSSTTNDWHALVRTIQLLQPDVIFICEAGDNSGNGTGSGVDSVANLTTVCNLMMSGGADPFLGGNVTTFVQNWAPGYSLPNVFVGTVTDNFNRNLIMSRYPFVDLNGDTKSKYSDIPAVSGFSSPGKWAPGGTGGIRGFLFGEIDLPAQYVGDLVVGGAHLKSGGNASDHNDRILAAQNVSWVVEMWYNGGGTGLPDPQGLILDSPQATTILDANTPVVMGGDWNEDEQTNGTKGPVEWLAGGEFLNPTLDGTDRDRTDCTIDTSTDLVGSRVTQSGGSKLDYIVWQDSIATIRRSFVFNSANMTGSIPKPSAWSDIAFPTSLTATASDHRPVVIDLILPQGPPPVTGACCVEGTCSELTESDCAVAQGVYDGDNTLCTGVTCPEFGACCSGGSCTEIYETDCDTLGGVFQGNLSLCANVDCTITGVCCFACTLPVNPPCPAVSSVGPACLEMEQAACVALRGFYKGDDTTCADVPAWCGCPGDVTGDGQTNVSDFNVLASNFGAGVSGCLPRTSGDLTCDGVVNVSDFNVLAGDFGCGVP